jgi:hypothetical protein
MIFNVFAQTGMAFQMRPLPPIASTDFENYQKAKHDASLKPETPVDKNHNFHKLATAILDKEAAMLKEIKAAIPATTPANDVMAEAAKKNYEGIVQLGEKVLGETRVLLEKAKTAEDVEKAMKSLKKEENYRNILGAEQNKPLLLMGAAALSLPQPVLKNINIALQTYSSEAAKTFVGDDTPVGPKAAVMPPVPAAAAAASTPPAKTPTEAFTDISISADYEKNLDRAMNGSNDAVKGIGRTNLIIAQKAFLNAIVAGADRDDPGVVNQIKKIHDTDKNFLSSVRTLAAKYNTIADEAAKAKLISDFQTLMADASGAAEQSPYKDKGIAASIIRAHKLHDDLLVANASKPPAPTPPPAKIENKLEYTMTGDNAHDAKQLWLLRNGFGVLVAKTDDQGNLLRIKGDRVGTVEFVKNADVIQDCITELKRTLGILAELPKNKYPQYEDGLRTGSKLLAKGLSLGGTLGVENPEKAYANIDNKSNLINAKRKIITYEKTQGEILNGRDTQLALAALAGALEIAYQDTLFREQYHGNPNPGAVIPNRGPGVFGGGRPGVVFPPPQQRRNFP